MNEKSIDIQKNDHLMVVVRRNHILSSRNDCNARVCYRCYPSKSAFFCRRDDLSSFLN